MSWLLSEDCALVERSQGPAFWGMRRPVVLRWWDITVVYSNVFPGQPPPDLIYTLPSTRTGIAKYSGRQEKRNFENLHASPQIYIQFMCDLCGERW